MVPIPDAKLAIRQQNTCVLLACLIFGEAENQNFDAMIGVANVVRNRTIANRTYMGGCSYQGVILRPHQFDCFSQNDPNFNKLLSPIRYAPTQVWERCYLAAYAVSELRVTDNTNGALFYFSPPLHEAPKVWGPVRIAAKYDDMTFCAELPTANAVVKAA